MKRLSDIARVMVLGLVTAINLAACGSSSTSSPAPATTVSGVAAAGTPIIGTVTIKDSTSPTALTKTVTIAADGKYTVDVAGMKAPYMVRADGTVGQNEYHLYSAGTSSDLGGTINITPLTDLIVANIAGSLAKSYFDNGSFSTLTAVQLTTQADALKAKLLPVLQAVGVSGSIDLLRSSFSADHTGLDAALDVLRVTADPVSGVATITNIITQEQMTSNPTTGTYTGSLTDTTGVASGVTDIQMLNNALNVMSSLFATSLPSETNATLLGLFDSATFLNDGIDLATFLSEMTSSPNMIGIRFANSSILTIDPAAGTAVVAFDIIQNGKISADGPRPFHMIKKNGAWRMQGDQYLARVRVRPMALYQPANTSAPITTGLNLNIEDPGAKGITSAVVSGKGLAAPITLVSQVNTSWFTMEGFPSGTNYYDMTDAQIALIADTGEVYTIELYRGATLAATYYETIKKRPYLSTELTAANFPTITAPTATALRSFNGGALTVAWTLPAGLAADWLSLMLADSTGSNTAQAEYTPRATDTSHSFTLAATSINGPFTPANRSLWLDAFDGYGRKLQVGLW